ncbi:hypothetical protein, partial [Nocardioides massiliensis]
MTQVKPPDPQQPAGPWDHLVTELQALRERQGQPSFQEIARRIQAQRMAQGQAEHSARVARSTVHFAFTKGRARINLGLVREIVEALGEDPGVVERWRAGPAVEPPPVDAPSDSQVPAPPAPEPSTPTATHTRAVLLLLLACLALNLAGREFVDFFRLPLHLDMVGTAVAAIALGPWRGAAVGVATNVIGVIGSGWISLPFALVNAAG